MYSTASVVLTLLASPVKRCYKTCFVDSLDVLSMLTTREQVW